MKHLKTLNSNIANDEENQDNTDTNSPITTSSSTNILVPSVSYPRILQNFRLVWLDSSIDQTKNDDFINIIGQLRQVVYDLTRFTDIDACIEFIRNVRNEKIFLICSEDLGQTIVPIIHENNQVNTIYIFSTNQSRHENWVTSWPKIKGIYKDYSSICKALKRAAKICDYNSLSISFVKKTDLGEKESLDSLDKSFMYTQILKEILLTIDFEEIHINEFLSYCREQFVVDNTTALKNVELIQKEYRCHEPIWWYTYDCFLYSMLNRALRLMEIDLIIKMGFFLKDLHNHIATLHAAQFDTHHHLDSFVVYRGQGLSQTDFDELQQTQGGLLAFNNFLSTSLDREVSFAFADSSQYNPDMIGVLFQIIIDLTIQSSQLANVKEVSYYQGEDEILFSMHSIFRIEQIKPIDGYTRLWEVDLILTSDNDPQLHELTEHIRKETFPDEKGWHRLGNLLIKLGQSDKAEQVCDILRDQTTDEREKGNIYHMSGMIKCYQGKYEDAVQYYEQSIKIKQKLLSPTHSDLAASYNNLGLVYGNMGDYSKALSYYEKAVEIGKKTLSENHPDFALSYNNIGSVYNNMGEYSKALSYYEKALEIQQKTLPENHPHLATSYNNIGLVYDNMGEYSKALSYYEKALEIRRKTLPENHPDFTQLLTTTSDLCIITWESTQKHFHIMKKHLKYDKKLFLKIIQVWQLLTTTSDWCINMGEYSKALSYYEKDLEILKKTLPENHLIWQLLTTTSDWCMITWESTQKHFHIMKKHLKYNKKLFLKIILIWQSCNNIGSVYTNMGEYSKALSYYEKALEIYQKTLPENHPHLATSYNNIGWVYRNINHIMIIEKHFNIMNVL